MVVPKTSMYTGEFFGKLKNGTQTTSLPPPITTPHPDVWPVIIQRNEGQKLVIGTQVLNVLVTSNMRLDQSQPPSIGPLTTNFMLTNVTDSLGCRIFVDGSSLKTALELAKDSTATRISDLNILYQLRQLRTKFDHPDSYLLCRASGPLTRSHMCRPYSYFVLADFDNGRTPGAMIFRHVAITVLKYGNKALLAKTDVKRWVESTTGNAKKVLQSIVDLFVDTFMPIIGNALLNEQLETLAELLFTSIKTANESAARQITEVFEFKL